MEAGEGPSNLDAVLAMFGQIEKKYLGTNSQTITPVIEAEKPFENSKSDKSLEMRLVRGASPTGASTKVHLRLSPDPLKMNPKNSKNQEGSLTHKVQEIFMKYTGQNRPAKSRIRRGFDSGIDSTRSKYPAYNKMQVGFTSKVIGGYSKPGTVVGTTSMPYPKKLNSIVSVKSPTNIIETLTPKLAKEHKPSPRISNTSNASSVSTKPPCRKERSKEFHSQTELPVSIPKDNEAKTVTEIMSKAEYELLSGSSSRIITASKVPSPMIIPQQIESPSQEKLRMMQTPSEDAMQIKSEAKVTSRNILDNGVKFIKSFTKGHADTNKNSLFGTPLFPLSTGSDRSITGRNRDTHNSKMGNSQGSHDDSVSLKEGSVPLHSKVDKLKKIPKLTTSNESTITPPKVKPPIKVYFKDQSSTKHMQLKNLDNPVTTPKSLMDAIFSKVNSKKKSKQNSFDYNPAALAEAKEKEHQSIPNELRSEILVQGTESNEEVLETEHSQANSVMTHEKLTGVRLFEQHLRNAVAGTNSGSNGNTTATVQIINSNIYFPVVKAGEESEKSQQREAVQTKGSSQPRHSTVFRQVQKSHQTSHSTTLQTFSKKRKGKSPNNHSYLGMSHERSTLGSRIMNKDTETSVQSISAADRFARKRKSDQWSDVPRQHLKTDKSYDSVHPGSSRTSVERKVVGGLSLQKSANTSAYNSTSRLMNRPRFNGGPGNPNDGNGSFSNTILLYKTQHKSYSPSKQSERRSKHQRERSSVDNTKTKKPIQINTSESDSALRSLSQRKIVYASKKETIPSPVKMRISNNSSGSITPLALDDGTLSEFTMLEELVNRGAESKNDLDSPDNSVLLNSSLVSPILANTTKIYKREESPSARSSSSSTQFLDISMTKKDLRDFQILDNVKEHDEFRTEKPVAPASSNNMKKKSLPAQVITGASREDLLPIVTSPVKKLFPIAGTNTPIVHHSKHKYYMEELLAAIRSPHDKCSAPFMSHIKHTAQSLLYIRGAVKPHEDDLLAKSVYLPPSGKRGRLVITIRSQDCDI
jgi:hypothetical protein